MKKVRIGIVGIGCMGSCHAMQIYEGKVENLILEAVCDINQERIMWAREYFSNKVAVYLQVEDMLSSHKIDAVLIATPHVLHPQIAITAMKYGLHVLTEKPAGIDTYHVNKLNEEAKRRNLIFGIMFNQRMNPLYQRLRNAIISGELGEIKRFIWIINNWYRTQEYYNSGKWRGTWQQEGGGVLMNQCPHNLDLWQWMIGMPNRVRAFCSEGKYHNISVEDDAVIYAEYKSGMSACLITSTGEYPGTNRIEVSGTKGKGILENGTLKLYLMDEDERELCYGSKDKMPQPDIHVKEWVPDQKDTGHLGILQNFTNAICNSEPLVAPGTEGIKELMICNAAYLSQWQNRWVELPLDDEIYLQELEKKQKMEIEGHTKDVYAGESGGEKIFGYADRWRVRW